MKFIPTILRKMINVCETSGNQWSTESFTKTFINFYENVVNYLEKYLAYLTEFNCAQWILMKAPLEWSDIGDSIDLFHKYTNDMTLDESKLFDEFIYTRNSCDATKMETWSEEETPVDLIWVEIFAFFEKESIPYNNLALPVEFFLSLPGTSAALERVFSLINNFWTDEKSQLELDTLKSCVFVKFNGKKPCDEFKKEIENNVVFLKKVHSSAKYD